ncbi:MAG: hypothetical protein OD814_000781 [Candidatus Alkanophagales archaeon MCA70_species_1]|nr:hypothetical protein [Candidatus Alkanophaga volatiphilum]
MDDPRLVTINTVKTSSALMRAAQQLRELRGFKNIFLDLPAGHEEFVRRMVRGEWDYEQVLSEMATRGIMKPGETRTYEASKYLFEGLRNLDCEVYCYEHPRHHDLKLKLMDDILLETFRSKIRGIDVEEWRRILADYILLGAEFSKKEGKYIAWMAEDGDVCLNLSEDIIEYLKSEGFEISVISIENSRKPLDILAARLRREILYGEKVSDDVVRRLVSEHIKFIDLVLKENGFESAYEKWKNEVEL